jgi:hypothetical protein
MAVSRRKAGAKRGASSVAAGTHAVPAGSNRPISYSLYLAALVISAVIFFAGIFLGQSIERQNLQSISDRVDAISTGANALESFYIVGDDAEYCPVYLDQLSRLDSTTAEVGYELAYFEDQKGFTDVALKQKYFALEATTLLLSQKVKAKCDQNYSVILYFYTNTPDACPTCAQQGRELLEVKKKLLEGVRIYSFDGDLNSAVVDAFKKKFGVSEYPSIVIDDSPAVSGLKYREWILDELSKRSASDSNRSS